MKLKTTLLPLFSAAFGTVGLLFHFWNSTAGTDGDGLIISSHPSTFAMTTLLLLVAALLVFVALFMDKTPTGFSQSKLAAIGAYVAALGLLFTAFTDINSLSLQTGPSQFSGLLSVLFCFASVGMMIPVGLGRKYKKPVNVWFYAVILIFFIFHLLYQYRLWTRQPQLTGFLFPLLASICLMLSVYYRACKDLGQPAQWQYMVFSQAAIFLSMMAMSAGDWMFYGPMTFWLVTDSLPGKETK